MLLCYRERERETERERDRERERQRESETETESSEIYHTSMEILGNCQFLHSVLATLHADT